MEDAHISNLDIGEGVALFGVFDGHGGECFYNKISDILMFSLLPIITVTLIYRQRGGLVCGQALSQRIEETGELQAQGL